MRADSWYMYIRKHCSEPKSQSRSFAVNQNNERADSWCYIYVYCELPTTVQILQGQPKNKRTYSLLYICGERPTIVQVLRAGRPKNERAHSWIHNDYYICRELPITVQILRGQLKKKKKKKKKKKERGHRWLRICSDLRTTVQILRGRSAKQ